MSAAGSEWVVTVRTVYRPWWGLGLVRRTATLDLRPPPGATYEDVVQVRERFLAVPATVSASIRSLDAAADGEA